MPGRYTIKVLSDFCASHIIVGYPGDCARLHGHNWKVELEATATTVDDIGICVDFKDLKRMLNDVLDRLDHRHLNDIPPFDSINPTAENLTRWIYQQVKAAMSTCPATLHAISIWETERSMTRYEE